MPTPPPSVPGGGVVVAPSAHRTGLLLVLILAAAALVRVPALYNSQPNFNSDEAVDALVLQHMLHGGGITFFNWDAKYYGIVESLLSLPFLAAGIAIPLASRLGSLVAFLLLPLAVFALGRRLYGTGTGLLAAALLIAFSPRVVLWSVLASGGYGLVVAWGSLTLVQYDRLRRRPTAANTALFGFMAGFGFYIYELFLVYLATFAAAWIAGWLPGLSRWISASVLGREDGIFSLRRSGGEPEPRKSATPARALGRGALLLGAFAVGWLPKLALLLGGGSIGAKRPAYRLATRHVMAGNLELLSDCVFSFLGVNPSRRPNVEALAGDAWTLSWLVGGALLAVYAVAWGSAARRAVLSRSRQGTGTGAEPLGTALSTEAVLVLLVPVTALLFVASPNPAGPLSDHYLLPTLSSLPLLAATLLARIRRRAPRAAWALAALLLIVPLIQVTRWYRMRGDLGPGLQLRRGHSDIEQIVAYLDRQGIRAAYGDYWTSYRSTLMSGERIVVAPLTDWDRYPPYTRLAAAAPTEAYIFVDPRQAADLGFPKVLATTGRRYTTARFGNYVVYTSPDRRRLLPPPATPELLAHPRARLEARVPGAVRAGAGLDLPVTVHNDGDAAWSALGQLDTHIFRVDVSYHWQDAQGHDAVFEGDRSFLPHDLSPGDAAQLTAHVPAPAVPGRYRLCLTLVQEGALWFDQAGAGAAYFSVEVTPAAGPGR